MFNNDKFYKKRVVKKAKKFGADLVGIADPAALDGSPDGHLSPYRILPDASSIIVVAKRFPDGALDIPHPPYDGTIEELEVIQGGVCVAAYLHMFAKLEEIACNLTYFMEDSGNKAVPISPSQGRDEKNWVGPISLRKCAEEAGLGGIGRANLVLTPEYGPRVLFAAVITSAKLEIDGPKLKGTGCEQCKICSCSSKCPVSAIPEVGFGYDRIKCVWGAALGLYKGSGEMQPPAEWLNCKTIGEATKLIPQYREQYPGINYYMGLSEKYGSYPNCQQCLIHCVRGKIR